MDNFKTDFKANIEDIDLSDEEKEHIDDLMKAIEETFQHLYDAFGQKTFGAIIGAPIAKIYNNPDIGLLVAKIIGNYNQEDWEMAQEAAREFEEELEEELKKERIKNGEYLS